MRRFSKILTVFIIALLIGVIGLVPSHNVEAQAQPQDLIEWAALMYPNPNFQSPIWLISLPFGLSVDWGFGPPTDSQLDLPLPGMPADNFSVRFSSNPPVDAGIYEFTVVADGGARLTVNDNVLFDEIGNTGVATFSGIAFVGSGPAHIVVDYVDYSGRALVELTWREVSSLFSGGEPVTPIQTDVATAEVAGVNGLALRSGPYIGASLVAVLRPGTTFTILAQNNTEGSFTWYLLETTPNKQRGWASGRYLNVNLQDVTQVDCRVPPSGGLSIAQQFVPGFTDTAYATQCVSTVANVLNQTVGGGLSDDALSDIVNDCASFGLNNAPVGGVIAFIDRARLVFEVNGVCTGGSCGLGSNLALQVAGQIAAGSTNTFNGTALQANVCFNTLAAYLAGSISVANSISIVNNCSLLLTGNIIPQAVLGFIDTVGSNICTESSTPTITLPEQTSVFETLGTLPNTGATISPRSVMNIRVRPSTRVAIVGSLPWGAEADLLARTVQGGSDHWYLIRYEGIIGWIDASFVNVRGNINDVPIY